MFVHITLTNYSHLSLIAILSIVTYNCMKTHVLRIRLLRRGAKYLRVEKGRRIFVGSPKKLANGHIIENISRNTGKMVMTFFSLINADKKSSCYFEPCSKLSSVQ